MIKLLSLILLQISFTSQKLIRTIEDLQKDPAVKNAIVSISIRSLADNSILYAHNADLSVNSASIMKLVSTGALLETLGEDYQFPTYVKYTGKIRNETLMGDLIVAGSGDPSLESHRYPQNSFDDKLIQTLKEKGIQKIEGSIIIEDPDFYEYAHPDSWIYGDIGNYYGANPHQFNYRENFYTTYFQAPHVEGEAVEIINMDPYESNWKVKHTVTSGPSGSGDQVYIYTQPFSNDILMKGTIPKGSKNFKVKGSIQHPARLYLNILKTKLKQNGIVIGLHRTEQNNFLPLETTEGVLYTHFSPPLKTLIKDCNFYSVNLYADAFAQKLSALKGQAYSLPAGAVEMKKYWEGQGLNLEGFEPKDGSGLSPSGLVTGNAMTEILVEMSKSRSFKTYLSSIPVLGKSGTVKYLDKQNITRGRVHAKSGSIEGTRSYAGYVRSLDNKYYAFSLIVNRYKPSESRLVRNYLEKIMIQLINI